MRRSLLLCLLLSTFVPLLEAGSAPRGSRASTKRGTSSRLASQAATRASRWVGLSSLSKVSRSVNDDCSGLAALAYQPHGVRLLPEHTFPGENGVTAIHRKARELGTLRRWPKAGDLVFFRETYDRNRDGERNDGLTHIGVVERVARDGTVTFVHRGGDGVKRAKLHLLRPHLRRDAKGRVLNDYLRRPDGQTELRLAGQLVAGFASVDTRWKVRTAPPKAARMAKRR